MSASNGSGISHYAWSRGLAAVVHAPARRTAAAFGPGGWEQGQPSAVMPAGVPPGSETVHLALPEWLSEQIAGLQFSAGGLHTEFVRLVPMLERLRSQDGGAAVLVLGEKPSVYLVGGGEITQSGEGSVPPDEASGWIVVFSGELTVPLATAAQPPVVAVVETPVTAAAAPRIAVEPEPAGAADEVYFIPASARDTMPEEVAAGIQEVAGPAGRVVPGLLDGSRTVADVAAMAGLTTGQARGVIGVLMAHKLAFRNFSRSRSAPRPGPGTCANGLDGL